MFGEESCIVHLVDVIASQDQDIFRRVAAQDIEVLVDRISGTLVPIGSDALLGRQQLDELAESTVKETPAALHVPDQALRLVLRADADSTHAGVDAVR